MSLPSILSAPAFGAALVLSAALCASSGAQTFEVDFSKVGGPPLVKTKFGVYQTPLVTLPRLVDSIPLLREINVADFRYEMGWGKPDVLAHDQISGQAAQLTYDFSTVDALLHSLKSVGARPLLALGYNPNPLKTRTGWPAWKDMPSDMAAWQSINRAYAARLKRAAPGLAYEVWNEPDMPDPGGKMFFTGSPQDYGILYRHTERGIRESDGEAPVGGPAIAYDQRYLAPILSQPMDFASIHAYDNYAAQIKSLRGALGNRPKLPIYLTEYASYTEFPPNGPQSRSGAAMRFFRDVRGLLAMTDVPKVYWAQWLDAGQSPGMGLLTWDGRRKAIFNAFKVYGMMPIDRAQVTPDGADGINLLASRDGQSAGVVLWNEGDAERTVTLNLRGALFGSAVMEEYRIDKDHASVLDNPASEHLRPLQARRFQNARQLSWTGRVPAQSVVFVRLASDAPQKIAQAKAPGTFVRDYRWFPDRNWDAYADFDARLWQARLGMGSQNMAVSQIGALIENPARRLQLRAEVSGARRAYDRNSLLGVRVDFQSTDGSYSRSVLYHGGLYNASRDAALPWAKGLAVPDQALQRSEINRSRPFTIDLARIAPPNWNRKRIVLSFVLQNAGRGSHVMWTVKEF